MTSSASMDSTQFDRVASKCKWSERSLNVAKALIVDELPLSEAAAANTMSPQQANVIRTRFLAKAEKLRVEEFMQREKPKSPNSALSAFATEIRTLRENGYTIPQIVSFLKENGVSTSPTSVRTFLRRKQ